jgi:hypothetical protein
MSLGVVGEWWFGLDLRRLDYSLESRIISRGFSSGGKREGGDRDFFVSLFLFSFFFFLREGWRVWETGSQQGTEEERSHSVGEDLQRREWAWGGQGTAGVDLLDVVFGVSAAFGNYLVSVCAGNWDVQVGPFPFTAILSEDWLLKLGF